MFRNEKEKKIKY